MTDRSHRKRRFSLLLIIVAVLILLNFFDWLPKNNPILRVIDQTIHSFYDPVQKVLISGWRWARDGVSQYFFLVGLKKENAGITVRLGYLEQENLALREQLRSYEAWDQIKKQSRFGEYRHLPALVIGHDPFSVSRTVWLDVGADDGVTENAPVIATKGLVGRVVEVQPTSSQVLLLTDPHFHLDVMTEQTRYRAMLGGQQGYLGLKRYAHLTKLEFLKSNEEIKPGDHLITTGYSPIYPIGLSVGVVQSIKTDEANLVSESVVIPSVDLTQVEAVTVLLKGAQ